jgi:hypothetical protein
VTFKSAIGAEKRVEWPTDIIVYSHCKMPCCWNSSSASSRLEATLQIDCRFGYDAALVGQPHDGRHHSIQSSMLTAAARDGVDFSEVCFRVKRHLAKNVGKACLIGLWTDTGRNRAVAVAELLFAILSWDEYETGKTGGEEFELHLEHTALEEHGLYHTGCDECERGSTSVSVENFKAAREVWDAATVT